MKSHKIRYTTFLKIHKYSSFEEDWNTDLGCYSGLSMCLSNSNSVWLTASVVQLPIQLVFRGEVKPRAASGSDGLGLPATSNTFSI